MTENLIINNKMNSVEEQGVATAKEEEDLQLQVCRKTFEFYHWICVLDEFKEILKISCEKVKENQWCLPCDGPNEAKLKKRLLNMLQFTALLTEDGFYRHFCNSVEHLTTLLSSSDMNVVLAVLNLLYVYSKKSANFITRLNTETGERLLFQLLCLAGSWGGKQNGLGLAECCQNLSIAAFPPHATTLHFEYYAENVDDKAHKMTSSSVTTIHVENLDKIIHKSPSTIMEEFVEKYDVPEKNQVQLFTHIRLAHSFSDYSKRMLCVQARLQALSVLVYCNAETDNVNSLLYDGFIEELIDVLDLQDNSLIEIKAAAVRALTSIIHLDRNPKFGASHMDKSLTRIDKIVEETDNVKQEVCSFVRGQEDRFLWTEMFNVVSSLEKENDKLRSKLKKMEDIFKNTQKKLQNILDENNAQLLGETPELKNEKEVPQEKIQALKGKIKDQEKNSNKIKNKEEAKSLGESSKTTKGRGRGGVKGKILKAFKGAKNDRPGWK